MYGLFPEYSLPLQKNLVVVSNTVSVQSVSFKLPQCNMLANICYK